MKDLSLVFDEIPQKRVAVIGDIMLDHYLEGRSTRMSPEAPIPIISVEKEWFAPGGAGNTAANIVSFGATVSLMGMVGDDFSGRLLGIELAKRKILTKANLFGKTTEKLRIYCDGTQVVRVDTEDGCIPARWSENTLALLELDKNNDAILVSDYEKGYITEGMARDIVKVAKKYHKILAVDTKPSHFEWFKGCYCIKPNKIEAEEFTGLKIETLEDAKRAGLEIKRRLETNVLLTLGSMGMMLFEEGRTTHFTSHAKDVFDVTGAGDTVLATFSLALSAGASMRDAAMLANRAAAIVIKKPGTASVTLEELKNSIL